MLVMRRLLLMIFSLLALCVEPSSDSSHTGSKRGNRKGFGFSLSLTDSCPNDAGPTHRPSPASCQYRYTRSLIERRGGDHRRGSCSRQRGSLISPQTCALLHIIRVPLDIQRSSFGLLFPGLVIHAASTNYRPAYCTSGEWFPGIRRGIGLGLSLADSHSCSANPHLSVVTDVLQFVFCTQHARETNFSVSHRDSRHDPMTTWSSALHRQ